MAQAKRVPISVGCLAVAGGVGATGGSPRCPLGAAMDSRALASCCPEGAAQSCRSCAATNVGAEGDKRSAGGGAVQVTV